MDMNAGGSDFIDCFGHTLIRVNLREKRSIARNADLDPWQPTWNIEEGEYYGGRLAGG